MTSLPFTDTAGLSMAAESVGVNKAKVLLLKIKLTKEIETKNNPRIFNSQLNHPPPHEV